MCTEISFHHSRTILFLALAHVKWKMIKHCVRLLNYQTASAILCEISLVLFVWVCYIIWCGSTSLTINLVQCALCNCAGALWIFSYLYGRVGAILFILIFVLSSTLKMIAFNWKWSERYAGRSEWEIKIVSKMEIKLNEVKSNNRSVRYKKYFVNDFAFAKEKLLYLGRVTCARCRYKFLICAKMCRWFVPLAYIVVGNNVWE